MITLIPPCRWAVKRAASRETAASLRWVYLGVSARTMGAVGHWLGPGAQRINIAGALQEEAKALRQPYIDYIGGLGAERDSSAWWFGSLSEKNPAISRAFLHICFMSVATRLCARLAESDVLLLVVESPCLRSAIATHLYERGIRCDERRESRFRRVLAVLGDWSEMLARKAWNIGRHAYRMVAAKALGFSPGIRNAAPAAADRPWVLLHNWVDVRAFDGDGRYGDVFFGALREGLERRGLPVAVVATVLPRAPYRRILTQLKRSGVPVLVPHAALTFGILLKWSLSRMALPPRPRAWPRFQGLDVSAVLDAVERMDWIQARVGDVYLISEIVGQWRRHLGVASFIYTFEGHTWERGYCQAVRRHFPKARLVGYQHSTVSALSLNYCLSPAEWGNVPFPDRVVTNGPQHYALLRQGGIPEHALACGGALRYSSIRNNATAQAVRRSEGPVLRILVTFSIIAAHAAELLLAVIGAFSDPRRYRVVLKFHPSLQAPRAARAAGIAIRSLPAHMQVAEQPVSHLLRDVDVLVYTDTTAAFEALGHGVPVVHWVSGHDIDLDPLERFPGVRVSTGTVEGLQEAVRAVAEAETPEREARARRWREVVDLLLPPPDEKTIDLFMPENVR